MGLVQSCYKFNIFVPPHDFKEMTKDIKKKLQEWAKTYHCADFIQNDPVQFPHRYRQKQDIEISGLLVSCDIDPVLTDSYPEDVAWSNADNLRLNLNSVPSGKSRLRSSSTS